MTAEGYISHQTCIARQRRAAPQALPSLVRSKGPAHRSKNAQQDVGDKLNALVHCSAKQTTSHNTRNKPTKQSTCAQQAGLSSKRRRCVLEIKNTQMRRSPNLFNDLQNSLIDPTPFYSPKGHTLAGSHTAHETPTTVQTPRHNNKHTLACMKGKAEDQPVYVCV